MLSSKALDKTLYKSVEISSFQKINIIGELFCLIVRFLVVNAGILNFGKEQTNTLNVTKWGIICS
ncbi:MAG: hypothetical protein LBM19_02025 [Holosporales bacterium]|nr:hypothetical protein [Holosporales bacterium]